MIEEIKKELEDWLPESGVRRLTKKSIIYTFNYFFVNPHTRKQPAEAARMFLKLCPDAPESIKNKIFLLSL